MIDTLHLGLSYCCNMHCKHCFVDKSNDKLDINKLLKTIDYLDKNGLFFVIYTFGEPLLTPKFWQVANYISTKNIIQTLMTNGSMINEEVAKKLKFNNVKNIYISIDSYIKEKHDKNRNYAGAFDKAICALKILKKYDFNLGIATTINDENINEMHSIVKLAKNIGINNISFLRQRINGKIIEIKDNNYYKFYEDYLCNYGEYNINIIFHDFSLIPITKKLYKNRKISKNLYEKYIDMNSCHNSTTLSIEPNGNIKQCNLVNNSIGNLNVDDIKDIFERRFKVYENIICSTKFSK